MPPAAFVPEPKPERLMSLSEMADREEAEKRGRAMSLSSNRSNSGTLSDPALLRHTIILSSHDSIVPITPVSRYLESRRREGQNFFEVVFFHGHHGEMMLYPSWVKFITQKIRDRCDLPSQ